MPASEGDALAGNAGLKEADESGSHYPLSEGKSYAAGQAAAQSAAGS